MEYKNGNVTVTIDMSTGTKTREWDGDMKVEFPESIDIKITNKCNLNCPFCHEDSIKTGAHGDLDRVLDELKSLPRGIELAIGGGNALVHPELPGFLRTCAKRGHICNITVNQLHLKDESTFFQVRQLSLGGLIHGIGISYNEKANVEDIDFLMKYSRNVVLHCIVGVHDPEDIMALNLPYKKVLWLGYKNVGRGETYEPDKDMMEATSYLIDDMRREFDVLSFDNLALEQLNVKDHVTDSEWDSYFQGDDFTISMYMDAVNGTYAPSSTRKSDAVSWDRLKLIDYFKSNHK